MRVSTIHNIQELDDVLGRECYLFGTGELAERIISHSRFRGINLQGILVSNTDNSQYEMCGLKIISVKDAKHLDIDNIVVAARIESSDGIISSLSSIHISNCYLISPLLDIIHFQAIGNECIADDTYISETASILSGNDSLLEMKKKSVISDGAEIYAINRSNIYMEELSRLGSNSMIRTKDNSRITIGRNACIGKGCTIRAEKESQIIIQDNVRIESNIDIVVRNGSVVVIGKDTIMSSSLRVVSEDCSEIQINQGVRINSYSAVYCGNKARVVIGEGSDFNFNTFISCYNSVIRIGKDNMFSAYTKMSTGGHSVVDSVSLKIKMHKRGIVTNEHVWCGMGATLLDGAEIGRGSIIGAMSVVKEPMPAFCSIGGVPARVLNDDTTWSRSDEGMYCADDMMPWITNETGL